MGSFNLTALISEIQRYHAGRSDLTDTIVVDQLNLVQERLARLWNWDELDSGEDITLSIAGTALADKVITTVNTYKNMYSVRVVTGDGSSRKLEYIPKRTFDDLFPEPEFHARGNPVVYTVWQKKLELYRVPDTADTLRIRGSKWPADFSEGTGSAKSDFDRKDDILINWVVSVVWDQLGEYERARRFFSIAKVMIDNAKTEQETKPDREIKPAFEAGKGAGLGKYWADPFIKSIR